MDEEDYEFGKKVVELLQKQFAKMALTKHQHTDIWDILQAFPAELSVWRAARCHRSDEIRLWEVGREVINNCWKRSLPASYMRWHNAKSVEMWKFGRKPSQTLWYQCLQPRRSKRRAACQQFKSSWRSGSSLRSWMLNAWWIATFAKKRLKSENGVKLHLLQHTFVCAWIDLPLTLRRWILPRRKHLWKLMKALWIGDYEYELYHTIIHTGEDASSGHYYAMGRRSEPTPSGDLGWYTMNDSQIKPAESSLLAGNPPEELVNDNAYVLFLRCKQAAPTPELRIPLPLVNYVKKEDKKQWGICTGRSISKVSPSIVSCLWANSVRAHGMLSSDSKQGFCRMTFPATFPNK